MEQKREYVSISEIQKEYLPVSAYLNSKTIGRRMVVSRKALEDLLASSDKNNFPL